jgi:hypothetical protein
LYREPQPKDHRERRWNGEASAAFGVTMCINDAISNTVSCTLTI